MRTARAVAALTSWVVLGVPAYRCFATGYTAVGVVLIGMVAVHALVEVAHFETRHPRWKSRAMSAERQLREGDSV